MVRNVAIAVAGFAYNRTLRPVRSWLQRHLVNEQAVNAYEAFRSSTTSTSSGSRSSSRTTAVNTPFADPSSSSFPGPISFVTSSFFIALLGLSILLNRIHHLVPPRRPFLHQQPRADGTNAPLPIKMRLFLRLPSLVLLLRSSTLLAALLLASKADSHPFTGTSFGRAWARAITFLTSWAGRSELGRLVNSSNGGGLVGSLAYASVDAAHVMWEVYIAVALAVVTETFVRALSDDLTSQATFNLLSFSFLLHIHATPNPDRAGQEWSPPTHLYVHLLLTLLELFTLHTSFIWTPPIRPLRLAISALYSLVGQVIVSIGFYQAIYSTQIGGREGPALLDDSISWEGTVWMSLIPDLTFELLALMTITLRFFAIVLRREELTLEGVFGNRSHWPKSSDDWGVGMIRYATSCLESSTLAGLANEVSPLRILAPGPLSLFSLHLPPAKIEPVDDVVRLGRSGNGESGQVQHRALRGRRRFPRSGETFQSRKEGFHNEIKSIEILRREGEEGSGILGGEKRGEVWRYFWGLVWRITFYVLWRSYRIVKRGGWQVLDFFGFVAEEDKEEGAMQNWVSRGTGEDVEDQEDEDYSPSEADDETSSGAETDSDEEVDEDGFSENEEEEIQDDAVTLLRDIIGSSPTRHRQGPQVHPSHQLLEDSTPTKDSHDHNLDEKGRHAAELAPLLLAHHLSPTEAYPLTRRRYAALTSHTPHQQDLSPLGFTSAIQQRRLEVTQQALQQNSPFETWAEDKRAALDESRQRFCVICTVEERTIVCWPCRCLTMCDECRDSLSQRTASAREHLCPTCRKGVEGYSRIWIP